MIRVGIILWVVLWFVMMGTAFAGDPGRAGKNVHYFPPDQDRFYDKYGGRVFQVWCKDQVVYVWKKPDGNLGYLVCSSGLTSMNARIVERVKRRWKPKK